jgi:hypothetical protein
MSVIMAVHPAPPGWALQRVATVLERDPAQKPWFDARAIARKTGLSKGLTKSCLIHLRRTSDPEAGYARSAGELQHSTVGSL